MGRHELILSNGKPLPSTSFLHGDVADHREWRASIRKGPVSMASLLVQPHLILTVLHLTSYSSTSQIQPCIDFAGGIPSSIASAEGLVMISPGFPLPSFTLRPPARSPPYTVEQPASASLLFPRHYSSHLWSRCSRDCWGTASC